MSDTERACVICGAELPRYPASRKTCSADCRARLNYMRWRANRHAAAERKREARLAQGGRLCVECGKPLPPDANVQAKICSDACRRQRTLRLTHERGERQAERARAERAERALRTVRVKITDLRTGEVRWEDRPLIPYNASPGQEYAKRRERLLEQERRNAAAINAVLGPGEE